MAEHDDNRESPLSPRRERDDELRPATTREVRDVLDSLHKTSNRVHEQTASIAVLKQRVDDHGRVIERLPDQFAEITKVAEAREKSAKEHAEELVRELEKRLSEAATRWIAIAAIVSGLLGGLIPFLAGLLKAGKP